jgi:Zn-dependent protease
MELIPALLVWYAVFLFSTTLHEAAHAAVAYWGGDATAYEGGQVTLDPLPHIRRSPFGMVVVPLLTFFLYGGGWMIGWASAPFDPRWASRAPKKYAAMSFAGPAADFLLAALAFAAMKVLLVTGVLEPSSLRAIDQLVQAPGPDGHRGSLGMLAMALSVMFSLNVLLGVFNLIPVPPLDGAAVLEGLFPKSLGRFFLAMRQSGAYALLGMVVAWKLFPLVAFPVLGLLVHLLGV